MQAAANGHHACVEALVKAGANCEAKSTTVRSSHRPRPFYQCACAMQRQAAANLRFPLSPGYLQFEAQFDKQASVSPLAARILHPPDSFFAAAAGRSRRALPRPPLRRSEVRLLACRPPSAAQLGCTALYLAALTGHQECAAALIAAGADCEAKDNVRFCRLALPNCPYACGG